MSKILKIVIVASFILSPIYSVLAVGSLDVVINEIAWMGSEVSFSDEWIELRNMTNQDIDLSGWIIENASKKNGSLEIPRDGKHIIPSNGYYLISYYSMADNILEPKTIINIITDWRVRGMAEISLANDYENNGQLKLRDNKGTLIDQTPSSDDDKWPAGDNKNKQTMERTSSGDWQNSQEPNGTPKAENSIREEPLTQSEPQPEPQPQPEPGVEPEIQAIEEQEEKPTLITYPSGILINEVTPSPQGSDQENEYMELINTNNIEVDISNWKIKDTIGSTKTYTFPDGTKIKANGYLVIMRPTSKITLNNDGDGLELKNPAEEIADSVNFGKALQGQSYNRSSSEWSWTTTLTPGSQNIITKESAPQSKQANLIKNKNQESAEVGPPRTKLMDSFGEAPEISVFLIALAVALFCSIAFLIIKSNIRGFWY